MSPRRATGLVWLLGMAASHLQAGAQPTPVALDTLLVQVGSRASTRLPSLTRTVQLLDRQSIESLPVRSVSGLLEWATGVEVQARSAAQSDLGIRGASFEQVVVLVNGIRMSDPQTGHFDLDLAVPLDHVERVEILRGPASAMYGADAMGGVVNIVTKDPAGGWTGRLDGGSWGSARASMGMGSLGPFGTRYRFGGEFSRSDGHRAGTDHEATLLHLDLQKPLKDGTFLGEVGVGRRDFGAQDFYAPYPSFEKTRTYTSSLRWASDASRQSSVEAGVAYRRHEDEFTLIRTDPSVYQNRHTSSQVGGEALARLESDWGLSWVVGGELFRDLLRSNSLGDREETRGALYLEGVVGAGSPAIVSAGIRQDWHEGFGGFFSPSISGALRLGAGAKLRGGVGRSFRAPTWTERYYRDPVNQGTADLFPEKAWSGEVGLDLAPGRGVSLAFTGFSRMADQLIDWARPGLGSSPEGQEPPPWETRNIEEADFLGLEAEASGPGPLGSQWSLSGTWLSVDASENSDFISKYALRPVQEQVNLGVRWPFGEGVTTGVNVQRVRRRGEDAYWRLDVRSRVSIAGQRFYVDATNLLGQEYPDITGAMAPGRAFFVGLEIGPGG